MNFSTEESPSSSSSSSCSSHHVRKDISPQNLINVNSSPLNCKPSSNTRVSNTVNSLQEKRKSGRKKFKETRHPVYRGVRQRRGKWVCELRQPHSKNSRLWLGTFSSPDVAARAYDVAALAIKGESASLNFPEERTRYHQPRQQFASTSSSSSSAVVPVVATTDQEEVSQDDKGNKGSTAGTDSTSSAPPSSEATAANASRNVEVYYDEEELFNMPGLLDSLAEGLMLTPPAMQKGFSWDDYNGFEDSGDDFSLWSE
ncbi:dehydration-responsive element-binding protein 1F-like [Humulus lupulus]|uniref:dehydration-responsive element-binding protein 1F-like n=1 Tax=Humulus lupulus TaxID=3486 RepID=UPI002B4034D9|nr:dehydration-responsive element-binding protein 1F-like [Humulus lupulus]